MNTGLDPELLTLSEGYIVPASCFLEAPERDKAGMLPSISYDNAAVEIRPEHSDELNVLADNTECLLHTADAQMRLARRRHLIPPSSKLSFIPAAELHFSARDLESVSSFGCSPSLTVLDDYSSRTTVKLCNPSDTCFRSAGFHIHQELRHDHTVQAAVAVLDGVLGLVDVLENHSRGWTDASRTRRVTLGYGRAGEYRTRRVESGAQVLEYRVMSPWPLANFEHVLWATSVMKIVCGSPLNMLLNVLDSYPDRCAIISAINHDNYDHDNVEVLHAHCEAAWSGRAA